MIVIADTSPICYLILIDQIDLLPRLYGKVMIPTVVRDELAAAASPTMIRAWISQPPTWLEVVDVENIVLKGLEDLDAGERAAIALAEQRHADLLIVDERLGRAVARARGLTITGLLGILREAGSQRWIDLPAVFTDLRKTSFRVSEQLLQKLIDEVND